MVSSKSNVKRVLTPREQYLQQWEADYTPKDVVIQGLSRAIDDFPWVPMWHDTPTKESDTPSRAVQFLDPSAGSGVFSSVFFDIMWDRLKGEIPIMCTNIEPRKEEELPLLRLGNPTWASTFEQWLAMWGARDRTPKYDCIATNPPFSRLAPKNGESWIPKLISLLQPFGALILYAKDELGQRSKAGAKLFKDHPPFAQYRVTGPVSHREDNKADSRCYSFWVWAGPGAPKQDYWIAENLPMLPTSSRQLQENKPSKAAEQ